MSRAHALRIARQTRAHVLGLYDALPADEFAPTAALTVQSGRDLATAVADIAIAGQLDELPLGLAAPDDIDRIEAALGAILDESDDPTDRLGRLAESEPMTAWRGASLDATREQGAHATRVPNENACPLCLSLAGPIPDDVAAPFDHPGCSCAITAEATS